MPADTRVLIVATTEAPRNRLPPQLLAMFTSTVTVELPSLEETTRLVERWCAFVRTAPVAVEMSLPPPVEEEEEPAVTRGNYTGAHVWRR